MKLFVYSKPDTMDRACHSYTDDVALCYADSLNDAVEIFSKLYDKELIKGHIKEARFDSYGICICTDY